MIGIVSSVLKIFGALSGMWREKNLMDAGAAKQIVKAKIETEKVLQDARSHAKVLRNTIAKSSNNELRSKWTRKD